jgi:hypothetical protein
MAERYQTIRAVDVHPGMFILVPPENGRHRSQGAIDGSSHLRVQYVAIDSRKWVEIHFEHASVTVHVDYPVKVIM